MSEALGGAGWNCTMEEFKKGINTLAAMGTGMFILHGFYYECDHQVPRVTGPPVFSIRILTGTILKYLPTT